MGGSNIGTPFIKHQEHDVQEIFGFIALDGSSNVIGVAPTQAPQGSGPYTLCKGLTKAIGVAGAVVTQPHTGTGVYTFTLDEAWTALLWADVTPLDAGAVAMPVWTVQANVKGVQTTGPNGGQANGVAPGTSAAIAPQTVIVTFRTASTGAAVNPAVSTGFWIRLLLKRTAVY